MSSLGCQGSPDAGSVRPPAVAGQFYPADSSKLRHDVDQYVSAGVKLSSFARMLISPHAGYVFSGPVAGKGYATIDKGVTTVILIGPSHHEWFTGLSISSAGFYRTPLGNVPLAVDEIAKLRASPLVVDNPDADRPEHSLEVQLPFLQATLPSFKIVPIITGKVDPEEAAKLILPLVRDNVLVVASSDLSHYHASDEARRIDAATIKTVLSRNPDDSLDACGETAIRVVMRLAKKLGLTPVLVDARNSFETAPAMYKDPSRVVGYASIAYVKGHAK